MTPRLRLQTSLGRRLTLGLRVWDNRLSTFADRIHKAPFYHFQTPKLCNSPFQLYPEICVDASCTRMEAGWRLQRRDPD